MSEKINSLGDNEIRNFTLRYGDQKIPLSVTKNRVEQFRYLSHQLLDSFKERGNFNEESLVHLLEEKISDSNLSSEDGNKEFGFYVSTENQ